MYWSYLIDPKYIRLDCPFHYWMVQESFLSEYHYEEKLDEDNARNLLSFGDDYRWKRQQKQSEILPF